MKRATQKAYKTALNFIIKPPSATNLSTRPVLTQVGFSKAPSLAA
jgi:hypothetical protein